MRLLQRYASRIGVAARELHPSPHEFRELTRVQHDLRRGLACRSRERAAEGTQSIGRQPVLHKARQTSTCVCMAVEAGGERLRYSEPWCGRRPEAHDNRARDQPLPGRKLQHVPTFTLGTTCTCYGYARAPGPDDQLVQVERADSFL